MKRPIRTLLFSTLYPSSVRPNHGIFVETRLRHLLRSGQVETRVVAPVPWFPSTNARFGDYATVARTPRCENHNDIEVRHPRYPLLPKLGMSSAPFVLAAWTLPTIARLRKEGFDFDLVDAHYYYPDGVAAAMLARYFRRPCVVTARGTDLNLIPAYAFPRRLIQWTIGQAAASVGVCNALADVLRDLGAEAGHVHVLRNGVDLERFVPLDRAESRQRIGVAQRRTLLSVGYLIARKGHEFVIDALARFPDAQLVIVGSGELRQALERRAHDKGVAGRTLFAGAVPQDELKHYYSAADVLILASDREGWPNVLLEAMACGTPVVATRVWGSPEVVAAPEAGVLCEERSGRGLAEAIERLFAAAPTREATRRYAERFGWDATTEGQVALFDAVLADPRPLPAASPKVAG